jgi:hypothetical protein
MLIGAANYLSVGQIYLEDQLMKEPLKPRINGRAEGRRKTGKISL